MSLGAFTGMSFGRHICVESAGKHLTAN